MFHNDHRYISFMAISSRITSLLAAAQRDVRTAVTLTADPTGRVQYARAAADAAAEIILDPDSSLADKSAARLCLNQALTLTGKRPKLPQPSHAKTLGCNDGHELG